VRIVIDASALPVLPGALEYARAGLVTGGANRNRQGLEGKVTLPQELDQSIEHLLFDPQTSGGLLIAVPAERAGALAAQLEADGLFGARVGRVEGGAGVVVEA
jgi:selenide,water dikinase